MIFYPNVDPKAGPKNGLEAGPKMGPEVNSVFSLVEWKISVLWRKEGGDGALWFNLRMNRKIGLHSQTKYFWNCLNEEYSKSSKIFKSYDGLFFKSILFMPSAKDKLQFKDP